MAHRPRLQIVREQRPPIPETATKATVAAWEKIHAAFEQAINDPEVDPDERRYMRQLAEVSGLSVASVRLARFVATAPTGPKGAA